VRAMISLRRRRLVRKIREAHVRLMRAKHSRNQPDFMHRHRL
jgi:hypothetical protein